MSSLLDDFDHSDVSDDWYTEPDHVGSPNPVSAVAGTQRVDGQYVASELDTQTAPTPESTSAAGLATQGEVRAIESNQDDVPDRLLPSDDTTASGSIGNGERLTTGAGELPTNIPCSSPDAGTGRAPETAAASQTMSLVPVELGLTVEQDVEPPDETSQAEEINGECAARNDNR